MNKRKRTSTESDHSRAERTLHTHIVAPSKSKAFKRFEKKVNKVLNGDTPTGKYTHTTTLYLPVTNTDWATVTDTDMGNINSGLAGTENPLEFFSPRQFKDAEGVLFNGKTPAYNSWVNTVVTNPPAAGENLPSAQVCKVNASSAMFHFKNHSQRQLTLEMYICYGKGGGTYPRQDLQDGFVGNGNISIVQAAGSANVEYFRNYGTQILNVPAMHEMWDITRISWEFEPGEEAWHNLKGPHGYRMDGSKKNTNASLVIPSWLLPDSPGCGCYVMFRLGVDVSLVSSTTGTFAALPASLGSAMDRGNRVAVARVANTYAVGSGGTLGAGGLAVVIQRHYNIELPEGFVPSVPRNSLVIFNGYGLPTGNDQTETNIDEDQPSTLPAGK